MCGINGYIQQHINYDNATNLLRNMNTAIKHRWPDDEGTHVYQHNKHTIWLGQVRLSIIDLSDAGHQPLFYDRHAGASNELSLTHQHTDLSIVFNGEIYNYQDIKTTLLKKWYTFTTQTDTEVILASYLERGERCVDQFNGMRAFCIYDKQQSKLFLSRDRLGEKPLYYYFDSQKFVFCSEIKWLLTHTDLSINTKNNIDPEALDFYFTTGYIPAPWTIYTSVKKLEARYNLVITIWSDTLSLKNYCYYTIPAYKPIYNKTQLITEWKQLLHDTVTLRMMTSDVPVGAFLSWWLDSSSVVAEMTKSVKNNMLNTFSIWFEGKYDESLYITIVKDAFQTNHHHHYFHQQDFEQLIDMIPFHYDEPFADYSNFPTTFVSQIAKKHVTVSLSGDGGDEIFGGYMMHQIAAQMEIIYRIPAWIRKILYYCIPKTNNNLSLLSKLKEAVRVSFLPQHEFYAHIWWSTLYKPDIYKQRTSQKLDACLKASGWNFVQAMIDFDLLYNTMADNFLVKTDRASMSCALEIRAPFLDHRWITRSRKVPTKRKTSWKATKILMRDIIKDIIPPSITKRGKKWFEPPIKDRILDAWYQTIIQDWLEKLHHHNILSPEWYTFYMQTVMTQDNSVYNVYKIKLFLLIKWYERGIEKIS